MRMKYIDKYRELLDMQQFKRIDEISSYNYNYYIWFEKDLLFWESDDDNTTEWYLVWNKQFHYLWESYTSEKELLHRHNSPLT